MSIFAQHVDIIGLIAKLWPLIPSNFVTQFFNHKLITYFFFITWTFITFFLNRFYYDKLASFFFNWMKISADENVICEMKIDEWKSATHTLLLRWYIYKYLYKLSQSKQIYRMNVRRRDVYTNTWTEFFFCVISPLWK